MQRTMGAGAAIIAAIFLSSCVDQEEPEGGAAYAGPIIDVHLHAIAVDSQGPPPLAICPGELSFAHDPKTPWGAAFMAATKSPACDNPIWSSETDDGLRDETLAVLEQFNVIGVTSGSRDRVAEWKRLAPDRIIAGHALNVAHDDYSPEDIAAYFDSGGFEVLAEVTNQYSGIAADDPRFDDYWRVAAERDIPVGIHIGTGPPGAAYLFDGYRARLHSPLALEEVLVRHPTLRVYIMHAAWPMRDELKAMLYAHPQLHVGVGVLQIALTRAEYYDFLEELVNAGYGDRIMFGSDQMVWPGMIEEGINAINDAPFLSLEQKQAILYGNAARFLRLERQ